MKILFSGLRNETISLLKENIKETVEFYSVDEKNLINSKEEIKNSSLIILGENVENPINLSQQIYAQDQCISILLISESANFRKIKQSLLFTPFVGPTIHIVSKEAGIGLGIVAEDHLKRTVQRRSYKNIKSSISRNPILPEKDIENIKNNFVSTVLEEAPVGLVLINKSGIILSLNKYTANIFNVSEKQVLGTFFSQIFSSELKHDIDSYIKSNTAENHILKYWNGSTQLYLNIIISEIKKDPSYKIILVTDVTSQEEAKKAIEEEAQKVNTILDSMPDMAWSSGPDGEINYYNKRWFIITGQDIEKKGGWVDALHPDDLNIVIEKWNETIKYENPFQVECRYWNNTKNDFYWYLTRATAVKNKDGKINQWIGTCTDIQDLRTIQKELQDITHELAASNEELYAANEEIMANNDELQNINEKLVKVNSDLDNFIYTASHDLKAPITNIEGLILFLTQNLQQKGWFENEIAKIIEMIQASIGRFRRTIGDLTEITKIQRELDLEWESISIPEIVNEVILDSDFLIKEADARIELDFHENNKIFFSRKNLKSVIYNLISNSLKYRSKERQPIIKIQLKEEGENIVLSVKDNGLGFDPEQKDKIFSMFKRLHSHVEGSGIGLYMVKKIIDNADGKISVQSQRNNGSTFTIFFKKHANALVNS